MQQLNAKRATNSCQRKYFKHLGAIHAIRCLLLHIALFHAADIPTFSVHDKRLPVASVHFRRFTFNFSRGPKRGKQMVLRKSEASFFLSKGSSAATSCNLA